MDKMDDIRNFSPTPTPTPSSFSQVRPDEDELSLLTQPDPCTPKTSRIPITAKNNKRKPQSSPEKIGDTLGQTSLFIQDKLAEVNNAISADSALFLQGALELMEKAVSLEKKQGKKLQIQQVTTHLQEVMNKQNASYGAKIDRLEAAVNSLVEIVKGKESTSTLNFTTSVPATQPQSFLSQPQFQPQFQTTAPAAQTWANAAKNNAPIGTTFQFQPQKTTKKPATVTKKEEKNRRVVLFKATTLGITPIELRNSINKSLSQNVVAAISTSNSGNTIITTTEDFSAEYFVSQKEKWSSLLPHNNLLIDTKWYKVLVHDVPLAIFTEENGGTSLLKQEIEIFNKGLKVQDIRWLLPQNRRVMQKRSSIILAFTSQEQATLAVQKKKLCFAGIEGRTEKFYEKSSTSQCQNCQGYGHTKEICRKKTQCGICSEEHLTKLHACKICEVTGKICVHSSPVCANCRESHVSTSQTCALRPKKPTKNTPAPAINSLC